MPNVVSRVGKPLTRRPFLKWNCEPPIFLGIVGEIVLAAVPGNTTIPIERTSSRGGGARVARARGPHFLGKVEQPVAKLAVEALTTAVLPGLPGGLM